MPPRFFRRAFYPAADKGFAQRPTNDITPPASRVTVYVCAVLMALLLRRRRLKNQLASA